MTDLFAQQGITFEQSTEASTHPDTTPSPITAPKIDMPAQNDNAPITSNAPKGQKNMTPDDKNAAIRDLYGDQGDQQADAGQLSAPAGATAQAPAASAAPAAPRDLFTEAGISAPSVTEQNQNALADGIPIPAPSPDADTAKSSSWAPVSRAEMSQPDFGQHPSWADQAASQAAAERNRLIQLGTQRYGSDQVNDWLNNPIGVQEAVTRAVGEGKTLPFVGGIQTVSTDMRLQAIAQKNTDGIPLSPDDTKFAENYLHDQIETGVRGFSRGGKVAYTMSSIPAWLMEFALADGAGKAVGAGIEGAAAEAGAPSVVSNMLSGGTRVAATTAFMPAQYAPAYAERRINAITAVTDKGQLVLKGSDETPAMSALLAYGYTAADVASALAGPGINKYVVEPSTKLLSTPITAAAQALPARIRTGLYEAYKAIDPNASYSAIMTPNGWNSMLSALGSFQVDKILRGTIDYGSSETMSFSDAVKRMPLDEDDLLVAGGLAAIHGGVSTSHRIATTFMRDKGVDPVQAQSAASNMSALEKDDYVNNNVNMPKSDYPEFQDVMTPEDAARTMAAKQPDHPYADIDAKLAGQDQEQKDLRLSMLNQKMEASILSPREMYEREALSAANLPPKPIDQSSPVTPAAVHYDSVQYPDAAQQIIGGQISAMAGVTPPPINDKQSGFNQAWQYLKEGHLTDIYAELVNDLQPIENLSKKARAEGAQIPVGQDSALVTSFTRSTPEWIRRNQLVNTTTWDVNGNQVVTGKGLKPIYDDFDNTFLTAEPDLKTRHADMDDFLIAQRLLEEAQSGKDVLVTDEQKLKSHADLQRLADKYGDNFKMFDTFANEIRDWDNRILHNLVTSGLKTQAWYDETVRARQHYSPLSRVVEDEFAQQSISRAGVGKDVTPSRIGALKQFKGSDKEIKNTFQSRLRNSALIMQKSAVNKLRVDIAKFAQYYPEDVKVSNPAIIREPVTVSYDPKLREKLEKMIEFLGGDVERGKGSDFLPRKALGSYSPSESLVRMRIGSTEGTLAHEAGHMLDYKIGLKARLLTDPEIKGQLQKLAEDRIGSSYDLSEHVDGNHFEEEVNQSPKSYRDYIKNDDEILANMFDAYVNSPEQLERVAPAAKAAFEKIIDENPQLAFLREIKPSTNRAVEQIESILRDMKGPKNSVPVYIKGSRKYLELSDPVYKAFNSMTPIQMGMVERFIGGIFRGAKKTLQFGATSTPDFMIRHFYRAIGTSFLNTKGKPSDFLKHSFVDIPKAVFAVIGKTELYHEWASSSGGLSTYMDLSDKGLAKMQRDIFAGNDMAKFLNPLNWAKGAYGVFKGAKEVSDYAPRVAVFQKLKESGASDLEAGLASLEATGNYVRHGSLVKRINQYAPFFNDMVQGGDRFVRSIKRDPAGFTMRALATVTLPQLIMTGYYLYGADDKTRDEYLNLPEWRRSVSMNVKIGDTWVPLPRYFAPGFVFGALPERLMIWGYKGNHPEIKNFWLHMLADTATSVSPVFDWTRAINPIVKSVLEGITNYSFFRGQPLFTGDMQKTAPAQQSNQYTSETAKMLGKLFNFSPTDIDNTVYDMSAKIGKYATQLSDSGINAARAAAGQPVNQKPTRATDNPIYGGLIEETPRGTGTESYTEFRDHVTEASQTRNELRDLKGKDAAEYQHANARLLAAYPQINAMQTQVTRIQHQIKLINSNTNISGDDKTDRINALNDQITRLVEGANMRYRAMTQSK